jgi:hypothetical protein
MLQTADSMKVFDDGFRPWPHVYKPGLRSQRFYSRIDANLATDLAQLRNFETRDDKQKYVSILQEVLMLFGKGIIVGKGIIDSLEFTMGDYLKQTDGKLSNGNRDTWELEATKKMLCHIHNNHAERPFAVLRVIWKSYLSSAITTKSGLALALAGQRHTSPCLHIRN